MTTLILVIGGVVSLFVFAAILSVIEWILKG